ncbi:tetratricopeptide repeat protein [Hydrogenophaga sp. 5NK40-0174]|uniref:tetratricopeptide repeat protein n=1 Tax=Hydrogenophaga sp. 5NK40-0174 TaxID=3127649 RepID=UPI003341293F
MMNRLIALLMVGSLAGCAAGPGPEAPVRICDASGCSERDRSSATWQDEPGNPEQEARVAQLTELAEKDPKAAFDLGLRYFRGDGVPRDAYLAIEWMRKAGDQGVPEAQSALGRFYLMGVEEMGPDPQEAEKWLAMAADNGDKEAKKLMREANARKKDEQAMYQWREAHRAGWYGWWWSGYPYYWHWGPRGWAHRHHH